MATDDDNRTLATLRDELAAYLGVNHPPETATRLIDETIMRWGLVPEQLPAIVYPLADAMKFTPAAAMLWYRQVAIAIATPEGGDILLHAAKLVSLARAVVTGDPV